MNLFPCWKSKIDNIWNTRASLVAQWWRICQQSRRPGFSPWVRKVPWNRKWQPISAFSPGKGYSPWAPKESDTTEPLNWLNWFCLKPPPFQAVSHTEQSSLCSTVAPCCLRILNTAGCTCAPQLPQVSLPPATTRLFSEPASLFLLCGCVHAQLLQSYLTLCDPTGPGAFMLL